MFVLLLKQTKGRGFDSHRGQADFSTCPVWTYTQSIDNQRNELETQAKVLMLLTPHP